MEHSDGYSQAEQELLYDLPRFYEAIERAPECLAAWTTSNAQIDQQAQRFGLTVAAVWRAERDTATDALRAMQRIYKSATTELTGPEKAIKSFLLSVIRPQLMLRAVAICEEAEKQERADIEARREEADYAASEHYESVRDAVACSARTS